MSTLTDVKQKAESKNETKAKSDSAAKFSNAYQNYYNLVYKQLYSRLKNHELTEEMVHEIFIIFNKKQKNIEEHKIKQWLFAAIRNSLNNYYRKAESSKQFENIENYYDSNYLSFVNGFRDARIILEEIYQSIEYKSEIEENVYQLIAYQNYSFSETAAILNLSLYKTKKIYNSIIVQLLKKLNKKGIKKFEDLL
jgi:RNA polymerase sigma factor (sigma-70 family)